MEAQFLHPREVYEPSKMLLYTAFQALRPQNDQSWLGRRIDLFFW